jgi:hypothetical protein
MSNLTSIRLLVGLACLCGVTTQSFAADEAVQLQIPNFSSVDFPWFPATRFLPPSSGPGPVIPDKTYSITRRLANAAGDVEEEPLLLADLNNPNLKPWVIDHFKESERGGTCGEAPI